MGGVRLHDSFATVTISHFSVQYLYFILRVSYRGEKTGIPPQRFERE